MTTLGNWMKEHGEVESYEPRVIDSAFGLVVRHRNDEKGEIISRLFYNPLAGVVNVNDRVDFPGAWELLGDEDIFARRIGMLTTFQKKVLVNLPARGNSVSEWGLARRVYGRYKFERNKRSRGGYVTAILKALVKLVSLDLAGKFYDFNDYPHWYRKDTP